ncbi:MAG: trypsin-like serine peptidase [Planctomycetota bacterium]
MVLNDAKHDQRSNHAIVCCRPLLITVVSLISLAATDIFAAVGHRPFPGTYTEAELVLGEQLTMADIKALPKAPASDLQLLDSPKRVKVQLPTSRLKNLADKGAKITVLRKFLLYEGAASQTPTEDGDLTTLAVCSGPYQQASNGANVWIPDASPPFCGDFVWSDVFISGAPAGAVVNCIDVYYRILHTYVGDLVVDLSDYDLIHEYNLWLNPSANWANLEETETGITAFNGQPANQGWTLWAQDCMTGDIGYIDNWWIKVYYEVAAPPANDQCTNAIAVADGVPYSASTIGATQDGLSSCGFNDTADVWHSYTPTVTGTATISLAGSTFDTTLALFNGCAGTELACNDDECLTLQSEIITPVIEANTYLIRIAGYNGETGSYTLTVTTSPCALPYEPNQPDPADAANDVSLNVSLSWNGDGQVQAAGPKPPRNDPKHTITPKVIYGDDDRLDEYEVQGPDLLAVGDATVALLSRSQLTDNGNGTFSLPAETYAQWYQSFDPILTGNPLCSDEPYRDQPNPAWCSGFLVAPDIVATAGHCVCSQDCGDVAFIFGFVMLDATTPVLTIDQSQIYYCSQIIASRIVDTDWSLIRLDRPVTDHIPVTVRTSGTVTVGEDLLVIGHPVGLPRKYAAGATVRDNSESAYFQANLDAYGGNSGSAVVNANTLQVEGILVRGQPDFVQDGSCDRSYVCPDTGCPEWEQVTRATEFAPLLPVPSYDVYFDTNDPPVDLLCTDTNVPQCNPTEDLEPCTRYYWQVVANDSCGQTQGPVWSFTTVSIAPDFDDDCDVDFKDLAKLVLYWLADEPSVNLALPDDIIDLADFTRLAEQWRWSPQP